MARVREELHPFLSFSDLIFFISIHHTFTVEQKLSVCMKGSGSFPGRAIASFLACSSIALCDPLESNIKNIYCVYFPYKMCFYHSIVHSSLSLQY